MEWQGAAASLKEELKEEKEKVMALQEELIRERSERGAERVAVQVCRRRCCLIDGSLAGTINYYYYFYYFP